MVFILVFALAGSFFAPSHAAAQRTSEEKTARECRQHERRVAWLTTLSQREAGREIRQSDRSLDLAIRRIETRAENAQDTTAARVKRSVRFTERKAEADTRHDIQALAWFNRRVEIAVAERDTALERIKSDFENAARSLSAEKKSVIRGTVDAFERRAGRERAACGGDGIGTARQDFTDQLAFVSWIDERIGLLEDSAAERIDVAEERFNAEAAAAQAEFIASYER